MPIEQYSTMVGEAANAQAVLRTQTLGPDDGFGHRALAPDPATDQEIWVLVSPFSITRVLAYREVVGGDQEERLWWVATSIPVEVRPGDLFILTEYGRVVHYIVQTVDPAIYAVDSSLSICKREEVPA